MTIWAEAGRWGARTATPLKRQRDLEPCGHAHDDSPPLPCLGVLGVGFLPSIARAPPRAPGASRCRTVRPGSAAPPRRSRPSRWPAPRKSGRRDGIHASLAILRGGRFDRQPGGSEAYYIDEQGTARDLAELKKSLRKLDSFGMQGGRRLFFVCKGRRPVD